MEILWVVAIISTPLIPLFVWTTKVRGRKISDDRELMSAFGDPESQEAYVVMAREGNQMFRSGDYEAAVVSFDEASRLVPETAGARRTRAVAYRNLQIAKQAQISTNVIYRRDPILQAIEEMGSLLLLLSAGGFGVIAPWIMDVAFWWPTLLGVLGLVIGLILVEEEIRSYRAGTVDIVGWVTGKRIDSGETHINHCLKISRTDFIVPSKIYDVIHEGSQLVLTVRGGFHFNEVVRNLGRAGTNAVSGHVVTTIGRGTSPSAQLLSELERERK